MITRRSAIALGISTLVLSAVPSGTLLSQSFDIEAAPSELERMRWWEAARFGLFLHWGLYSVAAGEWNGHAAKGAEHFMLYERIPLKEYAKLAAGLTLKNYDPDAWVALAKAAGMKYIVVTAKHHEGFAMFDSPSSAYNIVKDSPYGKDPMKPLAAACRKYGMKLCFYYSLGRDWEDPDVPTNWPSKGGRSNTWDYPDEDAKVFARYFQRKVVPQVRELLTQYGPVGVLWFDTPELISRDESIQLKALVRKLQPACIVNDRIGNGQGDFAVAEQHLGKQTPVGPWESCITMSRNWGYNKADTTYKSPEVLIRDLIEVVAAGGNFLLDTGPTAQGTFTASAIATMKSIGQWMAVNGESIYGSSPWLGAGDPGSAMESTPNSANVVEGGVMKDAVNDATSTALLPDLRFTEKGNDIYVFARSWHAPQLLVNAFAQGKMKVQEVKLLGSPKRLHWSESSEGLLIELPTTQIADIPIYVFKVRVANA